MKTLTLLIMFPWNHISVFIANQNLYDGAQVRIQSFKLLWGGHMYRMHYQMWDSE